MRKYPVRYNDLIKLLKPYGVRVKSGGKGSETILQRVTVESPDRGPQFTMKKHGKNPEIDWRIIEALLENLGIPEEAIWNK